MTILFRPYHHPEDYARVDEFLIQHYLPGNRDGNWLEPAWEYGYFHPLMDIPSLGKNAVWESNGKIVALVHYEWRLGEAYFQFDPVYRFLRTEMLDYAETNLSAISVKDGRRYLDVYVNNLDLEFTALVVSRGYEKLDDANRPLCVLDIPDPFPAVDLPEGYRLTSLAEDCHWAKVNRVLWRGFNHEGDPPSEEEDLESRRKMFDTPRARRDLKIAVQAPDGNFAAFCGMFCEPTRRYAYVEPVATDPDHRRLGLGKAAVLEGIRRCAALGATVAYVGNDLPIYRSIGFKLISNSECWRKYF